MSSRSSRDDVRVVDAVGPTVLWRSTLLVQAGGCCAISLERGTLEWSGASLAALGLLLLCGLGCYRFMVRRHEAEGSSFGRARALGVHFSRLLQMLLHKH